MAVSYFKFALQMIEKVTIDNFYDFCDHLSFEYLADN